MAGMGRNIINPPNAEKSTDLFTGRKNLETPTETGRAKRYYKGIASAVLFICVFSKNAGSPPENCFADSSPVGCYYSMCQVKGKFMLLLILLDVFGVGSIT